MSGNDNKVLLDVSGLSKSFAVPVLKDLNITVRRGEVHALMGSNGAGKSTLSNIICGVHQPSAGVLRFDGNSYQPDSIKTAESLGIRMVMQELNLFPTLSIAENLSFKRLNYSLGWISHRQLREHARAALKTVGMADLDPDTPVGRLGVGQQQLLEIARILAEPLKLLILDEPTAALTDPQIQLLFGQLNRLRDAGVGIIYISHRMDEISRIADRVSILRDGELVATRDASDIDQQTIVHLMAGQQHDKAKLEDDANSADITHGEEASASQSPASRRQRGAVAVKVEGLGRAGSFHDIHLDIHYGEVLGVSGLIGSGRTELLRAMVGADLADSGCLRFHTDDFYKRHRLTSPQQAIAKGMGMVVEDRKSLGLMLARSITDNLSISTLATLANRLGFVDRQQELINSDDIAQRLAIKFDDLNQPVAQLSGGNQQKVLIARWLLKDLPILLFDEPTRGVDARAKAMIHGLIREQAAQGKAVVVVSSETRELFSLSDRLIAISNGRLAGEFNPEQVTEEQLLAANFSFYSDSVTEQMSNP